MFEDQLAELIEPAGWEVQDSSVILCPDGNPVELDGECPDGHVSPATSQGSMRRWDGWHHETPDQDGDHRTLACLPSAFLAGTAMTMAATKLSVGKQPVLFRNFECEECGFRYESPIPVYSPISHRCGGDKLDIKLMYPTEEGDQP